MWNTDTVPLEHQRQSWLMRMGYLWGCGAWNHKHRRVPWHTQKNSLNFQNFVWNSRGSSLWGRKIKGGRWKCYFGGGNTRLLTHNIYLQRVAVLIKGQVTVIGRVFAFCLIIQLHKCCRKSPAWSILLMQMLLEEPLSTCNHCLNPRIHPKSTMGI